jgi:hypothetical protein
MAREDGMNNVHVSSVLFVVIYQEVVRNSLVLCGTSNQTIIALKFSWLEFN